MVEIRGEDGRDANRAIAAVFEDHQKELTMDAMNYWFEQSQRWLEDAASNRADLDSENRIGREKNALYAVQQSAEPPSWDRAEEAVVFSYPHAGAVYQEFGARPHEIRAKEAEVLAFEWPDAPREVKEEFEHTEGDLVFFESIDHPGIPAIGFVRKGRDRLRAALSERGFETEEFQDR